MIGTSFSSAYFDAALGLYSFCRRETGPQSSILIGRLAGMGVDVCSIAQGLESLRKPPGGIMFSRKSYAPVGPVSTKNKASGFSSS